MTTPYIDPKLIFASDAPVQDKPARFDNYAKGWDESRKNDGRPEIKQSNFLQQQNDQKFLYIHERGASLPYIDGFPYEENALVVKDSILVQKKGNEWKPVSANKASDILDQSGLTQQEINDNLLGVNGSSLINTSFSNVANSIKKSTHTAFYDQIIDVTWFGAVADWDAGTQTGTNSTQAIQNAINFYATLGTRRSGGRRAIKFPYGNYRIDGLVIPDTIGFGIDFIGDGLNSTNLWFDHNLLEPAIDCQVEFVQFSDMTIFGSLSDQNRDSALWRATGVNAKLSSNYPDIDIKFLNCGIFLFKDFINVYGRGCVFENCIIGNILYLMNIIASPETIFSSDSTYTSLETGMRHYTIRNSRFDVVSRIVNINGTGSQKEYINNISILSNDFTQCDALIIATDATIRRAVIADNTALYCFASGVVQVKSSYSCQMVNCNWSKEYNDAALPDNATDCINTLWRATGKIDGLIISNVIAKNILSTVATSTLASKNVKISNCHFPEAWTFSSGITEHIVFFSPVTCDGLQIVNNSFQTSTINGTYYPFYPTNQASKNTIIHGNIANFNWGDYRMRYTPNILVNNVKSVTNPTAISGRYYIEGSYVHVDIMVSINPIETTGDLAFSLPPISAVADNVSIASGYSGGGSINRYTGFTAIAGASMADIVVNPSNQQAELWKCVNLTQSRLSAADRSGIITMFAKFKYRF